MQLWHIFILFCLVLTVHYEEKQAETEIWKHTVFVRSTEILLIVELFAVSWFRMATGLL